MQLERLCADPELIRTPNLNRLAAEGVGSLEALQQDRFAPPPGTDC